MSVWDARGKPPLAQRTVPADDLPWASPPDLLASGRLPDGTIVAVLGHSGKHEFCFLDLDDLTPVGAIAADSTIDALGICQDGIVILATESGLLAITPATARIPCLPQSRPPA